jgi:CopG family nickel-responsive transcriptional regulator
MRKRGSGGRSGVVRFAISLPPDLAEKLDDWVDRRNSKSRSDAIRFLVGRAVTEDTTSGDPHADALVAVLLLYRHGTRNVMERLTRVEHRWGEHVRSSVHIHLRGGACAEMLLLAGERGEVEQASADLRGVKGLRDGRSLLVLPAVAEGGTGHRHPHPHEPPTGPRRRPRHRTGSLPGE